MPLYSRRLPAEYLPNSLTLALQQRRAQRLPVLDLTGTNPTAAQLDFAPIEPALAQSLAAVTSPSAPLALDRYQPDPRGSREVRSLIAQSCANVSPQLSPDAVFLTASSSESYAYLLKLLTDPGDNILVPSPSYPLFEYLAAMEHVSVRPYRLRYRDGWHIDRDHLASQIDSRTRFVAVVHPNNPTGSLVSSDELASLVSICEEKQLALVSDEVFGTYRWDGGPPAPPLATQVQTVLTFSLDGLSKRAALPQMKLGWMILGGPPQQVAQAAEHLEFIADTYLSVSALPQQAAPALLHLGQERQQKVLARVQENLALVRQHLPVLQADAGWCAMVPLPDGADDATFTETLLSRHGVLVQPGYFFDVHQPGCVVLSLLTEPQTLAAGVTALRQEWASWPAQGVG